MIHWKIVLLLSFNLLLVFSVNSQNPEIDSIKTLITKAPQDSTKVNHLVNLSIAYREVNLNESIRIGIEARDLAVQIGFENGYAQACKAIGLGYFGQSKYPESSIHFIDALAAFERLNDRSGIANILSNLGATNFYAGDDAKALDFYLRAQRVAEEINDQKRLVTVLINIGGVYNNKSDPDKALKYFLDGMQLSETIYYTQGTAFAAMNAGEIYLKKGLLDSAKYYFVKSIAVYKGTIDATFPLTNLGKIYSLKKDFDKAIQHHEASIKIAERLDARYELSKSLIGLAETQVMQGKVKQGIESYQRARELAHEVKAKYELKETYEALSKLYAQIGDFKNAYVYETQLTGIKDSIYNTAEDKKLQQLQFNFDIEKKESEINLLTKDKELQEATIQRQRIVNWAAAVTGLLLLIMVGGIYNRYKFVNKTNKIIKDERDRSKELLLNILPEETALELETNGSAQSRYYESATVLFTDFKGFSTIAGKLSPQDLVAELNDYFMAFDEIMGKYNLEKIKTIGDAYMCAGGIPLTNNTHPLDAVKAGLAMQEYMMKKNVIRKEKNLECWELRIGIHTGPIVAGVVGKKKYAYDIWGDTVNIASRMESNGEAGKVNISASTYQHIKEHYQCLYRGKISAKNIGDVDMYFIESPITRPSMAIA